MKKNLVLINSTLLVGLLSGAALARPGRGLPKTLLLPLEHAWAAPMQAAGDKKPAWKTTEEYNAYQAAFNEKDPHKKISLAEAFLAKYPDTDFKDLAYLQDVAGYQQLGDVAKMYQASRKAIEANPDNVEPIYWACVSFPYAFKATDPNSAQELSQAETDARHGLELLQKAQKPASISDEQFAQQIKGSRALFNNTIGFVALQRKDYAAAITAFKVASEDTPNDFTTFYRLGLSYWLSSPPDYGDAAWYMGRAASLARAAKNPFEAVVMKDLKRLYVGYHGSEAGLEDIITQTAVSADPPTGFKITPAEKRKPTGNQLEDAYYSYEDALKAGGDIAKQQWDGLKGQQYGGPGVVVSVQKGTDPDTLIVRIAITAESKSKDGVYDIALNDKQPDAKYLSKGDPVAFQGTFTDFALTPSFSLTLDGTIDEKYLEAAKDKAESKTKPKTRTTTHRKPS